MHLFWWLCLFSLVLVDYIHAIHMDNSKRSSAAWAPVLTCEGVKDEFARKIGTGHAIPEAPITDDVLSVCRATKRHHGGTSCCTEPMEHSFVLAGDDFVRKQMKISNNKLKTRIRQSLQTYWKHLEISMHDAYNQTSQMLTHLFHIPKDAHIKSLDVLFSKLREYIKTDRSMNLNDIIHDFFANLFPPVYEYVLLSRPSDRPSEGFVKCLKEFHQDIRPFGEVPDLIAKRIRFSFLRAKSVLETLEILLKVINAVEHVSINKHCVDALARMQYCSMCSGYVKVKPCSGFCVNVMRGCIPRVAEVSPSWDSLVVAFQNLGMLRRNNMQEVLGHFNGNVSEALLHAMNEPTKIYNNVIERCRDSTSSFIEPDSLKRFSTPKGLSPSHSTTHRSRSLHKDLQILINQLDNSKGFLARLTDNLCQPDLFETEPRSRTCWNGTSIGRYMRAVPEAQLIAQAQFNNELTVDLSVKKKLMEMRDLMKSQKRNLNHMLNEDPMIGDQSLGSGQEGLMSEGIGDDEDYSSLMSGSGSGEEPEEVSNESEKEPQNNFTPTKWPHHKEKGGEGGTKDSTEEYSTNTESSSRGGGAQRADISWDFLVLLVASLVTCLWSHHREHRLL